MAIEIIVEDGTGVLFANSYISIEYARTYAAQRGLTLSADDDSIAAMLIQAKDYLESKSCEYSGTPTYDYQELSWPRTGAYIHGIELNKNVIPKNLKQAQAVLLLAVNDGLTLMPNYSAADMVIQETVGPITTKYADPTAVGFGYTFTGADALLKPLFGECGQSGYSFFVRRV